MIGKGNHVGVDFTPKMRLGSDTKYDVSRWEGKESSSLKREEG